MSNRLTQQNYSDLVKLLEIKATDGKIDSRPGPLAEEASKHLDLVIMSPQIRRAAQDNSIEILSNHPRPADHPKKISLRSRVECLERRMNFLFKSLGIEEEECP